MARPKKKKDHPPAVDLPTLGRPPIYKPEYVALARRCAIAYGSTDQELADFFGVSIQTVHNWKAAYPDFLDALKDGKDHADAAVVEKLYKRATGYEHPAVKIFLVDETTRETDPVSGRVIETTTKKEMFVPYIERYPPDTTACIFWLKNRQPEQWREKIDHAFGGPNGAPLPALTFVFTGPDQKDRAPGDDAKLIDQRT